MSKKNRATEEALGELHRQLAENFVDVLKNGIRQVKIITNEDGEEIEEVTYLAPTPAHLNVIRQFLKDNGIDCVPAATNPLGDLAKSLPEFGEDGQVITSRPN